MMSRRRKSLVEELAELDAAVVALGRDLLASWPGRQIERFAGWLSRRLAR